VTALRAALWRLFHPRRTIKPTRDGWWCLFVAVGLGVAAINTGNNLLYLLVSALLALIVVSGILSEQAMRGLALTGITPEEGGVVIVKPDPGSAANMAVPDVIEEKLPATKAQAEAGDPRAQIIYALVLLRHSQLNEPGQSIMPWALKAAQAGMPDAQYFVGTHALHGMMVEKDEKKAGR